MESGQLLLVGRSNLVVNRDNPNNLHERLHMNRVFANWQQGIESIETNIFIFAENYQQLHLVKYVKFMKV